MAVMCMFVQADEQESLQQTTVITASYFLGQTHWADSMDSHPVTRHCFGVIRRELDH